jgi:hypothetical protein
MAGHRVALAALLAQPHPQAAVLRADILDRHPERRADPGERIDPKPDQRAIAQARMRRDVDAVEQRALRPDRASAFAPMSRRAGDRAPNPAGLNGTTWPVTSLSNRSRRAARRRLTLGAANSRMAASFQVATCTGWTAAAHQAKNSAAARS